MEEKNNKVVYQHKKHCGEIFYIGIGEPERPFLKGSRNPHWNNVVNKYGYEVEVILTGLTWTEACEIERYLIKYYGRADLNLGRLVNKTDGGELKPNYSEETRQKIRVKNLGRKASEETKKRMSNTRKGKKIHTEESKLKISKGNLGKVMSEESRMKMSVAQKGREGEKNSHYGKKHSEDAKRKMTQSKGENYILLNVETGIFYFGLKEASNSIGVSKEVLWKRLHGKSKIYAPFIKV